MHTISETVTMATPTPVENIQRRKLLHTNYNNIWSMYPARVEALTKIGKAMGATAPPKGKYWKPKSFTNDNVSQSQTRLLETFTEFEEFLNEYERVPKAINRSSRVVASLQKVLKGVTEPQVSFWGFYKTRNFEDSWGNLKSHDLMIKLVRVRVSWIEWL